jgi:hypothetical protein
LTIGAVIRNEKVTPSGTPALTKPMNKGTAEHEQNGVKIPRPAAATLPRPSARPARSARVFSGENALLTIPIAKTISVSSRSTFGVSYTKNWMASPR